MSDFITHKTPDIQPLAVKGIGWFTFMVGMWAAFFTLVLASPDTLDDIWTWLTGLPLLAEIAMWILLLPWVLALAVWQSSLGDGLTFLILAFLGAAWTGISVPRLEKL